jgi:hypothetical protein
MPKLEKLVKKAITSRLKTTTFRKYLIPSYAFQ